MRHNGVGVVVGVIEPAGRRVVAYGKSGAPDGRGLSGDTLFMIGSVSKTFVGLLLAEMVLSGEVKLDDPASKYLPPGVKMLERGKPITLRDLSLHTSGLPSMPTNLDLRGQPDPTEAYSVEDLYRFLSTYTPPREPGGNYGYSNLGVSLLGRLLALRAGQEYEELLRERVLLPLGMTSTAINLSPAQLERLAPGHDKDLQLVHTPEMKTLSASGSLRSSVNDLLNYVAANLGYQETSLRQAMQYQRSAARVPATSGAQSPGSPYQALGWRTRRTQGQETYYHDGGKQGYRSGVAFDPVRRTGVIVLSNARTDDQPIALARHLLTGAPLRPPPPAVPVRTFVKVDRKLLDSYAGQYRAGEDQEIRVARRDDYLMIDDVGSGASEFFAESAREFGTRVGDEQVTFRVEPDGEVIGLTWYPDGRSSGKSQEAVRLASR